MSYVSYIRTIGVWAHRRERDGGPRQGGLGPQPQAKWPLPAARVFPVRGGPETVLVLGGGGVRRLACSLFVFPHSRQGGQETVSRL